MTDGMLSLSWNNHKATFCHILSTLREKEKYTDVTVACEGRFYPVHKLVLSTCSEYFEKIFDNTPCKHPVIVLKDIAWDELEALLSYMYDGVVSVAQNDLARLIKAAEVLRIKGLAVPDEPPPSSRNDVNAKKSTQRSSSDDRSSPHPKRRRREESASSRVSPPSSPARASPVHLDSEPSRVQSDTRWQDHGSDSATDRPLDDRLHQSASGASSSPQPPVEVVVDETLVKEEVEESIDSRGDMLDTGMDYGSLGSDSRLDGSVGEDDSGQLLPNKFEQKMASQSESQSNPQPLPEAVVEALAGPSGMQGWLGGCDASGGFSGMEGYSGDGSQDMHPPQQGGPPTSGVQSGTHQMVDREMVVNSQWTADDERRTLGESQLGGDAAAASCSSSSSSATAAPGKLHQCPQCSYSTPDSNRLKRHMLKHTGERPFSCPYCSYRAARKEVLKDHINGHTGERPHLCPYCPYTAARRSNLVVHIRMHTGEKPYSCSYCSYQTTRKSTLNAHLQIHKNVN